MKDLYQKILNKPEIFRQRLAYGITAFLGIIMFAIWLSQTTLIMRETFRVDKEKEDVLDQLKKNAPSLQKEQMKVPENPFEINSGNSSDNTGFEATTNNNQTLEEKTTNGPNTIKGLEILEEPTTDSENLSSEDKNIPLADQEIMETPSQEITEENVLPAQ
jgi:hypothetical protein